MRPADAARADVCQRFRDALRVPATRADVVAWNALGVDAAEELSRAGYVTKGKKGSRVVYTRGEVECAARPDLPTGWSYTARRGTVQGQTPVEIVTSEWSSFGGPFTLWPREIDGVAVAAVEILKWKPGIGGFHETPREKLEAARTWARKEATTRGLQIRGEGDEELIVFAPLADREAAEKVAKLGSELSYKFRI